MYQKLNYFVVINIIKMRKNTSNRVCKIAITHELTFIRIQQVLIKTEKKDHFSMNAMDISD